MKKMYAILQLLCGISAMLAGFPMAEAAITKDKELRECLQRAWGIDPYTTDYILKKFSPLLEDATYHSIIDEFIEKSNALNLDFSSYKALSLPPAEDGIFQAPKQHLVVFENPWVRILYGSSLPGEHENFHLHAWKSLMVVLEPTTYEIGYVGGSLEISAWPRGVYELAGGEYYSCTNVGDTADECLRFEIKE